MKKNGLHMLLVGLGLITLFTASCKKDDGAAMSELPNDLTLAGDERLELQIQAFRQKCKFYYDNPGIKDGGLMSTDSAMWNLEAALNYTYSHQGLSCEETHPASMELRLPCLPGNEVNYTEVAQVYYKMVDSIRAFYNSVSATDKKILVSDIEKQPESSNTELVLKLNVVLGETDMSSVYMMQPFGLTDYWFYGYNQGKCGPYYGQGFGSDAAKEIEKLQHWFKPVPPANHRVFYTNVEHFLVNGNEFPNPDDAVPGDNQNDFLMFYNSSALPNYHECLHPDEMNFYFHRTFYVLTAPNMLRAQTNPPGKEFINASVNGNNEFNLGIAKIYHVVKTDYGIPHYSFDPNFPVEDPNF